MDDIIDFIAIFFGILVLIVLIIFLILFIGLQVHIKSNNMNQEFDFNIRIKLFFINIYSKTFPRNDRNEKDLKKKTSKEKTHGSENNKNDKNEGFKENWDNYKSLIPLMKENFSPIVDFFILAFRSIELEYFNTTIKLGLSNPSDTAISFGYIQILFLVFNSSKNLSFSAEPIFNKEVFEYDSEIIFKIKLFKPLLGLFRLFSKKSMLKLIWKIRSTFK
ncbi:hypothetical protein MBCUT_08400 [Methanobrevibacter cuticularis]|uniref:DUF2953 domain-containing protein n=1 Tax=Methanobrevibacter cuticularis TaxID=47311 RepID=A0A166EAN7_9EURY|nr:DUF2953 domain-containing protein [Methanobrevibacter cuticularis]KZX16454.1 hypothetical protein MBCUT_08400 [Methanobrevibacter cuticularis]